MTNLAVLGSTGSIGLSTLSVVDLYPERFKVVALAAGANSDVLRAQCLKYRPKLAAMADEEGARRLAAGLPGSEVLAGPRGVIEAAVHPDVDIVVAGISGSAGTVPVLRAVQAGKDVALANKETLVMAGELIMEAVRREGTALLPVDSEHNALHQCLRGAQPDQVKKLWLTASGGPFFSRPEIDLARVSVEDALAHPTWEMGRKISIDSATLMNKGLEVIEAHHLFDVAADRIAIAVHPQSVVHSMVEFVDGNFLAQMSITDMRGAILYALCHPERCESRLPDFNPFEASSLEFFPPDAERFPCPGMAYQALRSGATYPAALNAANEVAVEAFLARRIALTDIPRVIEHVLSVHEPRPASSLDAVLDADDQARREAAAHIAALVGV